MEDDDNVDYEQQWDEMCKNYSPPTEDEDDE